MANSRHEFARAGMPADPLQRRRVRGFSLLEMLVAFVIMAMALTALYRTSSGSLALVGHGQQYAYALEIAESLLAMHPVLRDGDWREEGETGEGYRWTIEAGGVDAESDAEATLPFAALRVRVAWDGPLRAREVVLDTLRPVVNPDDAGPLGGIQ